MIFNKVFRIFVIIVVSWMVGCFVAFLFMPIIMLLGAPSWLPLPWSDFNDFVQSSDGKVFVSIGFYSRVLCYDESGKFIVSYPYPFGNAKDVGLAVDDYGHVFFRTQHWLYTYDTSWNLLEEDEGKFESGRNWRLGQDGKPVFVNIDVKYPRVPDRAAKPGEYIFRKTDERKIFTCLDGSQLVREGNHIKRYSVEGELVGRYSGPWLVSIFTFPWPAFLAWPLAFLFAYIENRKKYLFKQEKGNVPNILRKKLLLDVSVTAIVFTIAVAAIVIGGSVVVFIANSLPDGNPMRFWLVPIVIIPFWIIVVITALWIRRSFLDRFNINRPADNDGDRQDGETVAD